MKNIIVIFILIAAFLIEGCTPSMNLSVKYTNADASESDLQLLFEFEGKEKSGSQPLDLRRIWIFKNDSLILDMEKTKFFNDVQSTWDFPSIPKGFKITFPKNLNDMPPFWRKDHLRFEFLAGGSYSRWEHKPNY